MRVSTLLITVLMLPLFATAGYAQGEEAPRQTNARSVKPLPNQFSFKFGLHYYPDSDYFGSNSAYFNESDLSGAAVELAYDYLWLYPDYPNTNLELAVGHYDGQADFQTICCSNVNFSTYYALLSVKYRFEPSRLAPFYWYLGTGVGYYMFEREVTVLGQHDNFSENVFGSHFLLGAGWPLTQNLGLFTEARYAFAKIKSADALDDDLAIGGLTVSVGVSWQFHDFAHILPVKPRARPAARK